MIMFNTTELVDKLGYEKWVINESLLTVKQANGIVSDRTIQFKIDGLINHSFMIKDSMGSNKSVSILEKLSPLIFVTSYKILDMIFEWILKENCGSVPWQFAQKINLYNELKQNSNLRLPELIQDEQELLDILFLLYEQLTVYRNQIIHGSWGSIINNGDLSFSFTKSDVLYEKEISFKENLNFAEAVTLIANELTTPSLNSPLVLTTTKYLLDKIPNLHSGTLFDVHKPFHYKVEYEVNEIEIVDVQKINDHLQHQSNNYPYSFELIVVSPKKRWAFPWSYLKDVTKEIILDSQVDQYSI